MTINTTGSTAKSAAFNKTFYDRKLLETAKTRFVHATFGQKRRIPAHGGKRVEFRKYDLFTPDQDALTLTEGVTPDGRLLSQTTVEAEVKQYGAYVEVSDLLDLTAYDPVIADSSELLGEQLGTVIEWVTRDAMCATTNVQYAGGRLSRSALTDTDLLTVDEVRKAVRTLKKNKARPFTSGRDGSVRKPHFVCICSPDAVYDLQNDPLWQDVSKYNGAEAIYSGEIGRLFGVVFVESTEAKVYEQSVHNHVGTVNADNSITLSAALTAAEKAYLSVPGNAICIGARSYTLATPVTVNTAGLGTITVTNPSEDYDSGDVVYSDDAGAMNAEKVGASVHATLVFGADSYGVIEIGSGSGMETIIKPHGSGGTVDPLDQRATVGAKVKAYAAKVLNPLWIVKIEHSVTK